MCLRPKLINRDGIYKESNYRGLKGEFYQIIAYTKCGYCEQCANEKANNWVIRNYYEMKRHKKKCFITLTYKENTYFLIKEHLQAVLKRLRSRLKYYDEEKIRFFGNGEYGTLHGRPHFHIIIYGWEESPNRLHYMDVNKKGNVIYSSDTINEVWKFGRTTYQKFDEHEIPYITLYNSGKDESARDYIAKKETVRNIIKELSDKKQTYIHRKAMIRTLKKALKDKENAKTEYICIKEFNTWSIALGWLSFYKNIAKKGYLNNYDFCEYIEDKKFMTPTPWVKKMANMGIKIAKEEMFRRESLIKDNMTAQQLKTRNELLIADTKKDNVIKWYDEKRKTIL